MKQRVLVIIILFFSNLEAIIGQEDNNEQKKNLILVRFLRKLPGEVLTTIFSHKFSNLTAQGAYWQIPVIKESCQFLVEFSKKENYWKNVRSDHQQMIQEKAGNALSDLDRRIAENNSSKNLEKLWLILHSSTQKEEKRRDHFCKLFNQNFINPHQPYLLSNKLACSKLGLLALRDEQTLMNEAVYQSWLMEFFLANHADVNAPVFLKKDMVGQCITKVPLLFFAVCVSKTDIITMLLDKNADPNEPCICQQTIDCYPLHRAIDRYNFHHRDRSGLKIIELLLAHGASRESRDIEGLTPYEYAEKTLHESKRIAVEAVINKAIIGEQAAS